MLFKNVATLSTELCEVKDNYHPGKQEHILEKANLLILDQDLNIKDIIFKGQVLSL